VAAHLGGEPRHALLAEAMETVTAIDRESEVWRFMRGTPVGGSYGGRDLWLRAGALKEVIAQLKDDADLPTVCLKEALAPSMRCSERITLALMLGRNCPQAADL
jgi:hypothetical protein